MRAAREKAGLTQHGLARLVGAAGGRASLALGARPLRAPAGLPRQGRTHPPHPHPQADPRRRRDPRSESAAPQGRTDSAGSRRPHQPLSADLLPLGSRSMDPTPEPHDHRNPRQGLRRTGRGCHSRFPRSTAAQRAPGPPRGMTACNPPGRPLSTGERTGQGRSRRFVVP